MTCRCKQGSRFTRADLDAWAWGVMDIRAYLWALFANIQERRHWAWLLTYRWPIVSSKPRCYVRELEQNIDKRGEGNGIYRRRGGFTRATLKGSAEESKEKTQTTNQAVLGFCTGCHQPYPTVVLLPSIILLPFLSPTPNISITHHRLAQNSHKHCTESVTMQIVLRTVSKYLSKVSATPRRTDPLSAWRSAARHVLFYHWRPQQG